MQQPLIGGRVPAAHWSTEALGSLHDLNHRFLELATLRQRPAKAPGMAGLRERLAPLTRAQRAALAGCPYALFDLRFQDERHWRLVLEQIGLWRVAEQQMQTAALADECADFARVALFYAWHIACAAPLKGRVLLGMSEDIAAGLRQATVAQLGMLALTEAEHLGARFEGCVIFWNSLIRAAAGEDPALLRRAQLHGLQVAAAAGFAGH